jgi:hypothetical protein
MQRIEEVSTLMGNRVAAEQVEAATHGVQVVYEDTREERFKEKLIRE